MRHVITVKDIRFYKQAVKLRLADVFERYRKGQFLTYFQCIFCYKMNIGRYRTFRYWIINELPVLKLVRCKVDGIQRGHPQPDIREQRGVNATQVVCSSILI